MIYEFLARRMEMNRSLRPRIRVKIEEKKNKKMKQLEKNLIITKIDTALKKNCRSERKTTYD